MAGRGLVVAALASELPRRASGWEPRVVGTRGTWAREPDLPGVGPVVITGTCGALTASPRGLLVLPDALAARDGSRLVPDETLVHALRHSAHAAGIEVTHGILAEADAVVDAPASRAALAQRTGAGFVDLESGAVARACARAGRPWAVLRVVVDSPEAPLAWLSSLLGGFPSREPEALALLPALLRRPGHVVRLVGLWRLVVRGRRDVGRVLDGAGDEVAGTMRPTASPPSA